MTKENNMIIVIGAILIIAAVIYLPGLTQFALLPSGQYRSNADCSFITNVPEGQPYQQSGAYVSINHVAYGSTGEVTSFLCNNAEATMLSIKTIEGYDICTRTGYSGRVYVQEANYGRIFETASAPSDASTQCQITDPLYCTADANCVPVAGCHPASCINSNFFVPPDTSKGEIICSQSCSGPLDCGAGHCGCVANRCAVVPTCVENWQTSSWSSCVSGIQTRTATDLNSCGTITNKPTIQQSCTTQVTTQDVITASESWVNKQTTLSNVINIAKQWIGLS